MEISPLTALERSQTVRSRPLRHASNAWLWSAHTYPLSWFDRQVLIWEKCFFFLTFLASPRPLSPAPHSQPRAPRGSAPRPGQAKPKAPGLSAHLPPSQASSAKALRESNKMQSWLWFLWELWFKLATKFKIYLEGTPRRDGRKEEGFGSFMTQVLMKFMKLKKP